MCLYCLLRGLNRESLLPNIESLCSSQGSKADTTPLEVLYNTYHVDKMAVTAYLYHYLS